MKKPGFLIILFIIMILLAGSVPASGAESDQKSDYQKGIAFFMERNYQRALEQFEQLGTYEDSSLWRIYCQGFLDIMRAGELEEQGYLKEGRLYLENAREIFHMLAAQKFEDSVNMELYCIARGYHNRGMTQAALDGYSAIAGTMDSIDRYWRIKNGPPYPTQAPSKQLPEKLNAIPAHAKREVSAFFGPGTAYRTQRIAVVNSRSDISICGREGNFLLIEVVTENGILRCWVSNVYIEKDAEGKETEIKSSGTAYLRQTAAGLYGPGDGYINSGISVPKGARVTVFFAEESYTMIEYTPPGESRAVRLWIPTECIGK